MKKKIIIALVVLLALGSVGLLTWSIINAENKKETELQTELAISDGVEDEINESVIDKMLLSAEDNIELYAIKTVNGLYLVSVKYEDNKVKYVEVEEKLV